MCARNVKSGTFDRWNSALDQESCDGTIPAKRAPVGVQKQHAQFKCGYAAFEMAVTRDFDAQSAVERELVLRLASLLWRLRRVTAIETGLFKEQARQLLQCRGRPNPSRLCPRAISANDRRLDQEDFERSVCADEPPSIESADQYEALTEAFVGLSNLSTYPLDRLGRYEAALWRQARQILFILRRLDCRKPWEGYRHRASGD